METIKELLIKIPQGFLQGLFVNGLAVTIVYLIFWRFFKEKFSNWKIRFGKRADAQQIRNEIKNAFFVFAISAIFSSVIYLLSTKGYTKLYTNYNDHSPFFAWAGFFILILVDDAWFYFMHRLLHHPVVFKYVHAVHHKSVDVNPYTSLSFHWLEPTLLTLWIIPVVIFIPTYLPVLAIVQVYGLFENIKGHLGYELFPRWWNKSWLRFFTSSTHHNMHHNKFDGNYGIHFRFWDKLFGTEFKDYEMEFDSIQQRKKGGTIEERRQIETTVVAEVELDFQGKSRFSILEGETVLEAILRNNIEVPRMCERGICGTCKCNLLGGEVFMHNREALSKDEEKNGLILICTAIPTSEFLEISV